MKAPKLADEIRKRAALVTNGDVEIVTISMPEIEEAVRTWDKARQERAKMFKRQGLDRKFS